MKLKYSSIFTLTLFLIQIIHTNEQSHPSDQDQNFVTSIFNDQNIIVGEAEANSLDLFDLQNFPINSLIYLGHESCQHFGILQHENDPRFVAHIASNNGDFFSILNTKEEAYTELINNLPLEIINYFLQKTEQPS